MRLKDIFTSSWGRRGTGVRAIASSGRLQLQIWLPSGSGLEKIHHGGAHAL